MSRPFDERIEAFKAGEGAFKDGKTIDSCVWHGEVRKLIWRAGWITAHDRESGTPIIIMNSVAYAAGEQE